MARYTPVRLPAPAPADALVSLMIASPSGGKHRLAEAAMERRAPSFLLPLWEKVARTQSAADEGSLSAETNPSPVSNARAHSIHPLHKGRGWKGTARSSAPCGRAG